ncbi:hypothetical protein BASA81_001135 [Batrachochytrium salamandrivorans]|nr:hypothetical protein BASA81_001135 [Batrachochytrium salamandrivorans]
MEAATLWRRIEANPLDYDAYVELLPLAKEKSPVCQRFHEHFPLDERTWLAWLQESGASSPGLFAKALEDYLSPALHVANLQRQWPTLPPADMRAQYEASAKACGSHFTRGHLFWDSWIQYELQQPTGNSDHVAEAMGRRATSALEHVEQYWREFTAQFPDLALEQRPQFDLALITVSRQQVQENVLRECRETNDECAGSPTTAVNTRLEKEWLNHLWVEVQQVVDFHAKRVLFERAVGDCCLSERIWHMYLRFLEQQQSQEEKGMLSSTVLRAVRNLPSSATCWAVRIRSFSIVKDDGENNSLWALIVHSVDQADLLEPASMWVKRHPNQFEMVADTIQHIDVLIELLLLDLPGANRRKNWDQIHLLRPTDESLWQMHIAEEAANKASEGRLRELYIQALGAVKTHSRGIEVLGKNWVRFEFAHMTLSSSAVAYNKAVDTVAKRKRDCSRGVATLPQLVPKPITAAVNKPAHKNKPSNQPEVKRIKEVEVEGESHEVFIGTLPSSVTKDALRAFFSNHVQVEGSFVHMVHVGTRRDGTRYAHVTFGGTSPQASVRAAHAACELSGIELESLPITILLSNPPPKSKPKPESVDASMEVETASMADPPAPMRKSATALFLPRSVVAKSTSARPSTKRA